MDSTTSITQTFIPETSTSILIEYDLYEINYPNYDIDSTIPT